MYSIIQIYKIIIYDEYRIFVILNYFEWPSLTTNIYGFFFKSYVTGNLIRLKSRNVNTETELAKTII